MTRKQEIDSIYDRLCWMLKGVVGGDVDPETVWEIINLEELSKFVQVVNDCWHLQDANSTLMNSCYIEKWRDFEEVAKIIYEGGGRINMPMDASKAQK
jgi:hypothetical protein